MNDEALEEIMGQLSSGNTITKEQCLYLMALYESRNQQVVQCVKRIRELEIMIERIQATGLLWQSHTVAAVDDYEPDRLFDADSAPSVSGASGNIPMAPGLVKWTSGNNAGYYSEVEAHTDGTVGISLRFATPNAIEVGDTFDIQPDCKGKCNYSAADELAEVLADD